MALLHGDVLPQYDAWGIPAGARLTDNGRGFCGTETHVSGLYFTLSDIEHRRTKVRSPRTNGFVEHFDRDVLEEFFAMTLRERCHGALKRCRGRSTCASFTTNVNDPIVAIASSADGHGTLSRSTSQP